ncbi:DEAD/DEAH box helicase family protein, partial [Francisella philomiragia]
MKTVINNVLDQHKSGLVILSLPTGYGKTYHIIETINNLLASKEFKENIYFITNQHVNIESVYDKITDKSNTLYLKSRSQILKNLLIKDQNLYSWFRDNLPKIKIKDKEALEKITLDMLNIEGYEYVSKAISEIKKSIIDYFSTNIKRKNISSKTQFESWLKASFEGKQIAKIFPEIDIDKKQVVMMT